MSKSYLIKGATLINEGKIKKASVWIKDEKIHQIFEKNIPENFENTAIINAEGLYLIPGVIDDQVHFREPGLTHKAEIYTEAKAAVAGGITSFMDMPNVKPQTVNQTLLAERFETAKEKSLANFSFYFGATNNNLAEILKTNPQNVCGLKVFMGSSTGNMLVNNPETLTNIFKNVKIPIAVHCEDENTIKTNTKYYKEKFGENLPIKYHYLLRSAEACFKSSSFAVNLAKKYGTRLHVLHLSSSKEMDLFDNSKPLEEKKITAEVCLHHLWFNSDDYDKYGTRIKWNPAVKTNADQEALWKALLSDKIDVIATDHAPHTILEKNNTYFKAPSGGPMVQHSLLAMLECYRQNKISLETIVTKMCHNPAILFNINNRGFIRENYFADLVLFDLTQQQTVEKNNILYKCGWSPLEGQLLHSKITHTFVNGNLVYENGKFNETIKGKALTFNRK